MKSQHKIKPYHTVTWMGAFAALFLAPLPFAAAQVRIEKIGTGTESLLGKDLTDPEDNGDEEAGAEDKSWNWKSIDSDDEPGFQGGEFAFNVFDNTLGPGNDKWCCTDATEDSPRHITVEFADAYRLTHFTVSSANDVPDRDPIKWEIQGSNNGTTFETIFRQDADEALWDERLQVIKFTLPTPSKPFRFFRYIAFDTPGSLHQIGEIEYFGQKGGVLLVEKLGTGTAALLGGDLTDPNNNGDETAGPTDPSWDWASIDANNEPAFEGGEAAFNIFDNKLGGGNDKWCCDDPTPANPLNVTVKFKAPVSLTHFTISSANDVPERDPRRWKILGSNDGNAFTPIFTQDSDTPLWDARLQVIKITLAEPTVPYQYIRYEVTDTAAPLHQLGEIEYFGTFGGTDITRLSGVTRSREVVTFEMTDGKDASVAQATLKLKIDNKDVTPVIAKNGATTTITYRPNPVFDHGSSHTYALTGSDNKGNLINETGEFKLPSPFFPIADLVGPNPTNGNWGTRFIFDTEAPVTGFAKVVGLVQNAGKVGDTVVDVVAKTVNYGDQGLFADSPGYPQAAVDKGCCGEDFINVNIGVLRVAQNGRYTFGVHSDDGFGLRIRGAKFISSNGAGQIDKADPEAFVHPSDTGDSNTRAVAELSAGDHRIEFFWWERGGGDHGEIYVAKGEFVGDGDTDTWSLIGDSASHGITLVASAAAVADADSDGIPDAYETLYGLNPNANDAAQDKDGDGLSNLDEFKKGTKADTADTDGDGLRDGVETGTGTFVSATNTGTDPTSADTDKDGLSDGVETGTGTFVSATNTGSNPTKADSDGDTFADNVEVLNNSNPNSAASTPVLAKIESLGTGTESLLGKDLTDPEDDGDEAAGELDKSWNWKSITADDEPAFDNGESAFNVFDNKLGGGDDKWCCTDATKASPRHITVEFANPVRLTHFTISSANDVPARDPQDWNIEGSNDGTTFTPIFVQSNNKPIWTERLEVMKITLPAPAPAYRFIRYIATRTADPLHQLGEIEYFGTTGGNPVVADPNFRVTAISLVAGAPSKARLTWNSAAGASYAVEASADLKAWTVAADNIASAGTSTTSEVNQPAPNPTARFYRVRRK